MLCPSSPAVSRSNLSRKPSDIADGGTGKSNMLLIKITQQ